MVKLILSHKFGQSKRERSYIILLCFYCKIQVQINLIKVMGNSRCFVSLYEGPLFVSNLDVVHLVILYRIVFPLKLHNFKKKKEKKKKKNRKQKISASIVIFSLPFRRVCPRTEHTCKVFIFRSVFVFL